MNKYSSGTHLRVTIEGKMQSGVLRFGSGHWLTIGQMDEGSVEIVQPEILPTVPYVDADGVGYIGRSEQKLQDFEQNWYGPEGPPYYRQVPTGLRPAKLVPVDE